MNDYIVIAQQPSWEAMKPSYNSPSMPAFRKTWHQKRQHEFFKMLDLQCNAGKNTEELLQFEGI